MRVLDGVFLGTIGLTCFSCGGVKLDTKSLPEASEVASQLDRGAQSDQVYSNDDSYKKTPEYWLGAVGVIARTTNVKCPSLGSAEAKLQWRGRIFASDTPNREPGSPEELERILGYPISEKVTAPELRASSVVNAKTAANVAALSFLQAEIGAESVAEIVVTDVVTQRVKPSREWQAAEAAWISANQTVVNEPNVCYVIAVAGYTYKTLAKKIYRKANGTVKGAYSGVSIGGEVYVSEQDYTLDHLFALSVDVLKRPVAEIPEPTRPETVRPRSEEIRLFRRLQPDKVEKFLPK